MRNRNVWTKSAGGAQMVGTPLSRVSGYAGPNSVDRENRQVTATITTKNRDRQGDIVEPDGLDFASYLQNPVVLWAHEQNGRPVGKIINIQKADDSVQATVQFADTQIGNEVFELYAGGYLRAWSLGFVPKRWEKIEPQEGQIEPQEGKHGGFHVLEAEVVEVSAVPVPANSEALTHALKSASVEVVRKSLEAEMRKSRGDGQGQGGDRQGDGGTDTCVCPKCGHEMAHERGKPCTEIKCPKCGSLMAGKGAKSSVQEGDEGASPESLWVCDSCGNEARSQDDAETMECRKCGKPMKRRKPRKKGLVCLNSKGLVRELDGQPVEVADAAFSKSIAEAVAAGKVMTVFKQVKGPDEVGTVLEWEPIRTDEKGAVTEARVLGILVKVYAPDSDAPPTEGTHGESRRMNAGAEVAKTLDAMDVEIAKAQADLARIEVEMLEV